MTRGVQFKRRMQRLLIHLILIIFSIIMIVPFVWMTLTAFKTVTEATSVSPFVIFPSQWRTDAFTTVWNNMNFLVLYKNTLLLIFFRVVCACLTATLAGYAFARLKFKGRDFMFSLILFQMMIPSQIFIIPQFLMISNKYNVCSGIPGNCNSVRYFPAQAGLHGTSWRSRGGSET